MVVDVFQFTVATTAGGESIPLDPTGITNRTVIAYRDDDTVDNDVTYTVTNIVGDGDTLLEPGELLLVKIVRATGIADETTTNAIKMIAVSRPVMPSSLRAARAMSLVSVFISDVPPLSGFTLLGYSLRGIPLGVSVESTRFLSSSRFLLPSALDAHRPLAGDATDSLSAQGRAGGLFSAARPCRYSRVSALLL